MSATHPKAARVENTDAVPSSQSLQTNGAGGAGGKQPRPNKWYLKALRATKAKKGVIRSGATNLCWRKWYFGNDCRTGDSQAERS